MEYRRVTLQDAAENSQTNHTSVSLGVWLAAIDSRFDGVLKHPSQLGLRPNCKDDSQEEALWRGGHSQRPAVTEHARTASRNYSARALTSQQTGEEAREGSLRQRMMLIRTAWLCSAGRNRPMIANVSLALLVPRLNPDIKPGPEEHGATKFRPAGDLMSDPLTANSEMCALAQINKAQ